MKSVGLMTVVDRNYGSMLQAYALQQSICELGYSPVIINNIKYHKKRDVLPSWKSRLKRAIKRILASKNKDIFHKRNTLYQQFVDKHLILTSRKYYHIDDLSKTGNDFDAFVAGSDQIWNPLIWHYNEPEVYFLTFAPLQKRISYAASFGITEIPCEYKNRMAEFLNDMAYISVREKHAVKTVFDLTGRTVPHVLDPTLLLDAQDWKAIANTGCCPRTEYILCYFLENETYMREYVSQLAKSSGYPIVMIPRTFMDCINQEHEVLLDIGPSEFLGLISQAALVCTDSFHGTAFSINFGVPFFSFRRMEKKHTSLTYSRISSILQLFDLADREVIYGDEVNDADIDNLDFPLIQEKLERQRFISLTYLKETLENVTKGE